MKCPKCGADMKNGLLYCESCGEDIHIVPDFEPEVEYNLEQTLNHIVKDIGGQNVLEETEPQPYSETVEETVQDWDSKGEMQAGRKRRPIWSWLVGIFIVFGVIGAALGVSYSRYHSVDYQVTRAEYYIAEEDYEKAISFYNRALELIPESIELKFALAEVYFLKNNKIEYEYLLRDIVKDSNADMEQLESAYGKLIAIYRAREDYKTINELLLLSGNESIMSIYQSYLALTPEFSVKEGYYNSIQPLKLTTFGTGRIYYTLDGSEPDESSLLYTAPILLENGEYCIKAVYINENEIASDVVTKTYHIEIEKLPAPEISVISGDYYYPLDIEVEEEIQETIYYTMDGSTPTEQSNIYSGPIHMPLGESVFKFICIRDGKFSDVIERSYNLQLLTSFGVHEAEKVVVQYAIRIDKIKDESGYYDETNNHYKYKYQYVTNINDKSDYYIISEFFVDAEGAVTRTGTHYAVNVYDGEIFKLQRDEKNNYVLVEIEKEAL